MYGAPPLVRPEAMSGYFGSCLRCCGSTGRSLGWESSCIARQRASPAGRSDDQRRCSGASLGKFGADPWPRVRLWVDGLPLGQGDRRRASIPFTVVVPGLPNMAKNHRYA